MLSVGRLASLRVERRHLDEQVLIACTLVATAQMTWSGVVPALPRYGAVLGIDAFELSSLMAAFGIGRLLSNVPAGLVADRFGPRPVLHGSVLALIVVTVVTARATTYPALLAMRAVAGVLGGAVVTVGLAAVTTRAPVGQRGSVLGSAQVAQLAGGALGPVLGGVLLDLFGLRAIFLLGAAPLAVALIWSLLRSSGEFWEVPPRWSNGKLDARRAQRPGLPAVAVDLAAFVGVNVVSFAVFAFRFGGEQSLVPILGYAVGMTASSLGLGMGAVTLVSLAIVPLVSRLLDSGRRRAVLLPALGLSTGASFLYPLAHDPSSFTVILISAGLGSSTAGMVAGVLLADVAAPGRTGRAMGIFRTSGDLGAVLGPLALGLALSELGPWGACAILAGITGLAALVQTMLGGRGYRQ